MAYFSLKPFLDKLAAGNIPSLHAQVHSTFNRLPDKVLNSNQKIILQSFMIFLKASDILEELGLTDKFQLPTGILAKMSGLSRYQARNAIKTLPAACRKIKEEKLLKYGETIDFEVYDEDGTPIEEINENSSGASYFYIFRYTEPKKKAHVVKGYSRPHDEIPQVPDYDKPGYDPATDPYFAEKQKELSKLDKLLKTDYHHKLVYFDLDDIIKAVAHFTDSFEEKKQIAINQKRDPDQEFLNHTWLRMCLEKKYWTTKFTPKQKISNEVDKLKINFGKIRSFVTEEKVKTPLTLTHKEKPLHRWNDFRNIPEMYGKAYQKWNDLNQDIQKEIYNLALRYYRYENTKPVDKRDPIVHDKEEARKRLQQIISIMHTNFI